MQIHTSVDDFTPPEIQNHIKRPTFVEYKEHNFYITHVRANSQRDIPSPNQKNRPNDLFTTHSHSR